nr:hypothetical protein [Hyphomonas sp. Mor2]
MTLYQPKRIKFRPGALGLREKFSAIFGHYFLLLKLEALPKAVEPRVRRLFGELEDLIKDDEMGLIDLPPEAKSRRWK